MNRLPIGWTSHANSWVAVAVLVLYLSSQMFFQPHLLDFWTPADLAQAWAEYLLELTATAIALAATHSGVEGVSRRFGLRPWMRLALDGAALYLAAALFGLAMAAARHRPVSSDDIANVLGGAIRWAVIGWYLVAVQTLWRRVRETDSLALDAQAHADALQRERQELRLQFLRAQIEPHFLFNTLANVRRLYRTDPDRGSEVMGSLKRYLQAALPGVRREDATLADELNLVRAYLALIAVRMGGRLRFEVRDDSAQRDQEFPAMVVLTLVENAIKHGLEPSPQGGSIQVVATSGDSMLRIDVADDGVGLGNAHSSGSGVGLANVRSRLLLRYGPSARLEITGRDRGVLASIAVQTGVAR